MPKATNEYTDQELEDLFGISLQDPAPETNNTSETATTEGGDASTETETVEKDVETTKAFAKRLKERTDKAVADERERIAKDLGYESYDQMQKLKERKYIEDQGIDPELLDPIVDKLVENRLANDPRMKELDGYRQAQAEQFAKKELQDLAKLTGVQYTSLDDVPKDVIEDWKTSGSLKQSYMKLHGEELIRSTRKAAEKGSTDHLQSNSGSPASQTGTTRMLTDKEKAVWKMFYPGISDEELNKKTINN